MDYTGLFKLFHEWGPSALTSALVFVTIHLIKKIDANSKKDEERGTKLRDDISKVLNGFGERLSRIELESVKKEEYWRDLSGWRAEINRVSDKIDSMVQNFIIAFKQGGK